MSLWSLFLKRGLRSDEDPSEAGNKGIELVGRVGAARASALARVPDMYACGGSRPLVRTIFDPRLSADFSNP
jgi:hypothetical protein